MHDSSTNKHRKRGAAAALVSALALAGTPIDTAEAQSVDLQILVLSAGDDIGTKAFRDACDKSSVPYTHVDLHKTHKIDEAFLIEKVDSRRNAKFQAVVLPNDAPLMPDQKTAALSDVERAALTKFETEFKIREFLSYTWPSAAVGLNAPDFSKPVDGVVATVTSAGKSGAFAYLNGPVEFENNDPKVDESWVSLAQASTSFTPYVTMPIPSSGGREGAVLGVFTAPDRRQQLVLTASINANQYQYQLLFPGILEWLTYGVHLGTASNYLAVHVDDVFVDNQRWNCKLNCVAGAANCPTPAPAPQSQNICPEDTTNKRILMTKEDVDYLLKWQADTGMYLDIAFNGVGSERFPQITQAFIDKRKDVRFINHTYEHKDLDKEPLTVLIDEIGKNQALGSSKLKAPNAAWFSAAELITGEHSGLQRKGVTGIVNAKLPEALATQGIAWIGSDTSIKFEQETITFQNKTAHTVPRYPMNIYYNVGKKIEEVDQYNAIHNVQGNPNAGDFETKIIPAEVKTTIRHIIANDPRPHYVHQPNLTEDRIIYPVLNAVLAEYGKIFSSGTPLYNLTMTEQGTILLNQNNWAKAKQQVKARVDGSRLTVSVTGAELSFPITVPTGSSNIDGLLPGSKSLTGWRPAKSGQHEFNLPQRYGQ